MQKRWIHPLFKPSKHSSRELQLFCPPRRFSPVHCGESEININVSLNPRSEDTGRFGVLNKPSRFENIFCDKLFLFLSTTFVAISFSVLTFFAQAKFSSAPGISALDFNEFKLTQTQIMDKNVFLSKLTAQGRRELDKQINFVASLMKGSRLSKSEANRLASMIVMESIRSGYDPLFVTAVIKSESTFNRHAVSYAGAMGLMQIMPDTGRFVSKLKNVEWKGTTKLNDPEYNIRLGIAYLKHLEKAFNGNKKLMLIAYNWGPKNVSDALNRQKKVPSSCVKYAKTILNNHTQWNNDFINNMAKFQHMNQEFVS